MVRVPDYISTLKPYKSGNKLENGMTRQEFSRLINLASNENPLGASPMGLEALSNATSRIAVYPDPAASELVSALAGYHNIAEERIITGSGSDSLIQYIVNAFMQKGDSLMTADCTFIGTYVNVNKYGFGLVKVPTKNYGFDLEAMTNKIDHSTKIIYIANPNNPTGTMISHNELTDFIDKVPDHILIVLDEAYYTYSAIHDDYPDGTKIERPNLIVLRTLSKTLGLAGIRLGYAIGPADLIGYMYRVKLPFEPNILAQHAGMAAIGDSAFIEETVTTNKKTLGMIEQALEESKIKYVPGKANFTMAIFENEDEAKKFVSFSLSKGFVVRHLPMFGLENAVRISTGTIEQTSRFCKEVINQFHNN